jgi:hypothetical protein
LTGESGVSSAAITASHTFSKWLRRVINANFSGCSVSSEMLMRSRPGLHEALQVLLEQEPVGRHGDVLEAEVLEPPDELHDAPAHQRLAARDADLGDAELQASFGEGEHLLQGEDMALVLELNILRHAVLAAEVAAVGNRNP